MHQAASTMTIARVGCASVGDGRSELSLAVTHQGGGCKDLDQECRLRRHLRCMGITAHEEMVEGWRSFPCMAALVQRAALCEPLPSRVFLLVMFVVPLRNLELRAHDPCSEQNSIQCLVRQHCFEHGEEASEVLHRCSVFDLGQWSAMDVFVQRLLPRIERRTPTGFNPEQQFVIVRFVEQERKRRISRPNKWTEQTTPRMDSPRLREEQESARRVD